MTTELESDKFHQLVILGSGTSTGIPMLGCSCAVCSSDNAKDKRLRTSLLIKTDQGRHILIETGPDLRAQLLRENIKDIDAAIVTHDHADHLHGLDDLRPFCFGPPPKHIPLYCDSSTSLTIHQKFPYIFDKKTPVLGGGIPQIDIHVVPTDLSKVVIAGLDFHFFHNPHGHGQTLGFVVNKLGVIFDCHEIKEEHLQWLQDRELELLIIDCVQEKPHRTHLTLDRALEYVQRIQAKQSGLIHMGHYLSHLQLEKLAIPGVFPTFDQQKLTFR